MALGHTEIVRGRIEAAIAALEPALDVIETRGIPTWLPWAAALRGYAVALAGRTDEGRALLERSLERAVALPFLFGHSQWVAWLAHVQALDGRLDEAHRLAEEALRLSRTRGTRGYEAWSLWILGEIEERRGATEAAETFARPARALAETLGMQPLVGRCDALRGRLHLKRAAGTLPPSR
jgi:tetratricopeptide (TPR) repeat protein